MKNSVDLSVGVAVIAFVGGILLLVGMLRISPTTSTPDDVTFERLAGLSDACKEFRRHVGTWPPNLSILTNVIRIPGSNIIADGWGHAIVLRTHTNAPGEMWLISYGADGKPGGEGYNADFAMEVTAR